MVDILAQQVEQEPVAHSSLLHHHLHALGLDAPVAQLEVQQDAQHQLPPKAKPFGARHRARRGEVAAAGQRVIESTIREKLPEGFQRAEYLQEKGMVDRVVTRADLPRVLGRILSMLMGGNRLAA